MKSFIIYDPQVCSLNILFKIFVTKLEMSTATVWKLGTCKLISFFHILVFTLLPVVSTCSVSVFNVLNLKPSIVNLSKVKPRMVPKWGSNNSFLTLKQVRFQNLQVLLFDAHLQVKGQNAKHLEKCTPLDMVCRQ